MEKVYSKSLDEKILELKEKAKKYAGTNAGFALKRVIARLEAKRAGLGAYGNLSTQHAPSGIRVRS
jgi:hypothetical protein